MIGNNAKKTYFDTIVKQSVNDLSRRQEVQAIFLFGSVAKGKASATSDVDLIIVCKEARFHMQVEEFEHIPIKIVAVPPDGLEDTVESEVNQGQYPSFAGGKILYDPQGILADFCQKINQ
jgi:predicted nucleotidyltransferase